MALRLGPYLVEAATRFGPRLVSLRREKGPELFAQLSDDVAIDLPGSEPYRFHGGHRLWAAPEVPAITYAPDDHTCVVSAGDDELTITAPADGAGLVKQLTVSSRRKPARRRPPAHQCRIRASLGGGVGHHPVPAGRRCSASHRPRHCARPVAGRPESRRVAVHQPGRSPALLGGTRRSDRCPGGPPVQDRLGTQPGPSRLSHRSTAVHEGAADRPEPARIPIGGRSARCSWTTTSANWKVSGRSSFWNRAPPLPTGRCGKSRNARMWPPPTTAS